MPLSDALRPLRGADADALDRLFNDPVVGRYLWDGNKVERHVIDDIIKQSQANFQQHGHGLWVLDDGAQMAAVAGLWPFREEQSLELIYAVAVKWQGKGIATRLAHSICNFAFTELGFDVVRASTDAPNRASVRVLEKAGFEGTDGKTIDDKPTLFFERRGGATVPYAPGAFEVLTP